MRYRLVAFYTIVDGREQIDSVDLLIKSASKRAGRLVRKRRWPDAPVRVIEK